ncbi:MAG: type II secretion system F family protein, partial [Planctomycetota bacterium]|nr:type II secretion system F family protein [Planctomycetota bacterium]
MASWKQHRLVVWLAIVDLFAVVVTIFLYANDSPAEISPNKWIDLRIHWTRCLLVIAAVELVMLATLYRNRVRKVLQRFFCATAGPLNLAVLRICVFALLFPGFNHAVLGWHLQLPESLCVPPLGLDWAAGTILFNGQAALAAAVALSIMCICAMCGAFTRWTVPLATILALWIYGVPQFDGKVDHNAHHLIWFAMLLSVSPCGHALSIDALRSAWKNPTWSSKKLWRCSQGYALPMRFVWLLMGIIYFFPGAWKLWSCGLDWALTDNLKYHLYFKWAELGGWQPSIRIDRYPLLYRAAGLMTIVFEIGFIFCILTTRGRAIALVAGIMFHRGVSMFMRIAFWPLEWCYVSLVDWQRLLQKLGKQIFPEKFQLPEGSPVLESALVDQGFEPHSGSMQSGPTVYEQARNAAAAAGSQTGQPDGDVDGLPLAESLPDDQYVIPTYQLPSPATLFEPRLRLKQLEKISHRLGRSLKAGISITKVLESESRNLTGKIRRSFEDVLADVSAGDTLSSSVSKHSCFPALFCEMV